LKRRRVRLWEWEMLFPNPGFFPQISHTEGITAAQTTKAVPGARPRPNLGAWIFMLPDGLVSR
jgi:hypothetical protein